jgi:hypothetical protein
MVTKYRGTLSSGGKKTTSATNTVIKFSFDEDKDGIVRDVAVKYIFFETFASACTISINGEDTIHPIDANSSISFQDIDIKEVKILESTVEYRWTALF